MQSICLFVIAAQLCSRVAAVVAGHTMAQQQLKAKLNYKPGPSVEVFYSGGAVSLSVNGHVACACQDDIKVIPAWWYLRWHQPLSDTETLARAADSGHPQRCSPQDPRWSKHALGVAFSALISL